MQVLSPLLQVHEAESIFQQIAALYSRSLADSFSRLTFQVGPGDFMTSCTPPPFGPPAATHSCVCPLPGNSRAAVMMLAMRMNLNTSGVPDNLSAGRSKLLYGCPACCPTAPVGWFVTLLDTWLPGMLAACQLLYETERQIQKPSCMCRPLKSKEVALLHECTCQIQKPSCMYSH